MDFTLLLVERVLEPAFYEFLGNVTFQIFLLSVIIFGAVALIKKWVVIGWTYKEKEKQVERLENRLNTMEALAWRGTHMAKRGTETAEYFAYEERQANEPHL